MIYKYVCCITFLFLHICISNKLSVQMLLQEESKCWIDETKTKQIPMISYDFHMKPSPNHHQIRASICTYRLTIYIRDSSLHGVVVVQKYGSKFLILKSTDFLHWIFPKNHHQNVDPICIHRLNYRNH